MATTTTAASLPKTKGGGFLVEERTSQEIFTPEDLTEEHRAIARTADEFWNNDVAPHLEAIDHGDHDAAVAVLKKSAELGLTAIVTDPFQRSSLRIWPLMPRVISLHSTS